MRQAILVEPKHIEFKEVVEPKAADLTAHQVLVNIKRIGICGSEIHSYHGLHPATFYPVVQGHEYSGVVMAVGSEVTVCKPGDHITARPQLVCGKCNPCKRGQYNVCEHLRVQAFQADGAAQDFFVVDDDRVAKLPEGMSLDYGAMIEPSAVGAHASNRTDVKGKNVVVSGAGTIGNLIAQFCIARGAKNVLITDVSDLRLAKARECGIKHTLNITKKTLKEAAQELFGEEGYQVGFEVAGVEVSIRSLMETIEKGSDIVVVAVFAKDPALSMFYLGEHELRLIGSMMYRHEDYLTAIDYVSKGIVNLKPLVSNRFAFEEYDDAYKFIDTHRESSMKVLIDFEQKPGEKK
jgi:2-desacetyl-2-hydroxyethyl bacteriochlorophyllide A dehydrogenase